jgi:predicted dehydrogenase
MPSVNRRTFLASAGSGAAALALGSGARAAGPNDQLRIAVIGFHGRGESHIDAFTKNKQTAVATLCDIDSRLFDGAAGGVEKKTGKRPECVQDLRRVLDDKNIDAVSIATTNHWHALATVWACQAGKDVYVEKPVSHNFVEGTRMVEAARKYKRVVQTGTQNRSTAGVAEAVEFLGSGGIGDLYMARALCFKPRGSIGHKADSPVPAGVDYSLWLGPAPERPFNPNRFHYQWHWNWDYGNGDLGNQGIHQMDVARWGLGKSTWPTKITGTGGRFGYKDDGETPNTEICTFRYPDCELVFEVRGLPVNDEQGVKVGNIFYGSKGYLTINGSKWASYLGEPGSQKAPTPGPKGNGQGRDGEGSHFDNFVAAVLARDPAKLHAEILEGHRSSALCHLGNIAYRTGRALTFDPKSETFPGDAPANALLSREYRSPFTMPEKV